MSEPVNILTSGGNKSLVEISSEKTLRQITKEFLQKRSYVMRTVHTRHETHGTTTVKLTSQLSTTKKQNHMKIDTKDNNISFLSPSAP